MNQNGVKFVFESDDSRCEGLDPNVLDETLIFEETAGLEHKEFVNINDGETVTLTVKFVDEDCLREWFDNNVPKHFYKVATRI